MYDSKIVAVLVHVYISCKVEFDYIYGLELIMQGMTVYVKARYVAALIAYRTSVWMLLHTVYTTANQKVKLAVKCLRLKAACEATIRHMQYLSQKR